MLVLAIIEKGRGGRGGRGGGVWMLISLPHAFHFKMGRRLALLVNLQGGQKVNCV